MSACDTNLAAESARKRRCRSCGCTNATGTSVRTLDSLQERQKSPHSHHAGIHLTGKHSFAQDEDHGVSKCGIGSNQWQDSL